MTLFEILKSLFKPNEEQGKENDTPTIDFFCKYLEELKANQTSFSDTILGKNQNKDDTASTSLDEEEELAAIESIDEEEEFLF